MNETLVNLTQLWVDNAPKELTYSDLVSQMCTAVSDKIALASAFLLVGLILYQVIVPELKTQIKRAEAYERLTTEQKETLFNTMEESGRTLITVGVAFLVATAYFQGVFGPVMKVILGLFMLAGLIIKLKDLKIFKRLKK